MRTEEFNRDDVLNALRRHIGAANGATAATLVREIMGAGGVEAHSERQLRHILVALRLEGFHVCAHPTTGIFMAATPDELNDTCQFLYSRAMTSLTQIARMKNLALPDLAGQLRLRT